jgi:hypothetical protein
MRHILFDSLFLGLEDLLTKRLPALESFDAGKASKKLLTTQRDKIAALPPAITGRPLADELASTDEQHDGIGAGIWFHTEGYLRHPDTAPELIDAIKQIRAAFITGLDELTVTYEAQAMAAKARKDSVADLTPKLNLFPVAGGTLLNWVQGFLAAGETLDLLLSKRADAKDRKLAAQLRTELIGTLTRLRKNLAVEQKNDANLPADLDAQVFGYFDMLETKAADAAAAAKKAADAKKPPDPVTPPAPPAPPPDAPQ